MRTRAILAALLFTSIRLVAQTATGTISGTVMDATQAHVPAAHVTLTETGTNISRTQNTDSRGSFEFRALPTGVYKVQVDTTSFAKATVSNIVLDVAQARNLDVLVKPASATETVEVGSTATQLQITDSSLSSVIDQVRVETLPLNGRNVLQLAAFAAGIQTSGKATATERQANYGPGFVVGGQRDDANVVLVDGIEISGMELNNYPLALPSVDDVAEFNLQSSNYPAQFGGNSGAIINIATKRGVNTFHGSLFEFVRNTDLDARNYFATYRSILHRNQFGGTAGGPVIFPFLYNGRNKTFWFFSYEGIRQRTAVPAVASVPTLDERAGKFASSGVTILDPITKVPLPNDQILNPNSVGLALLNLYPAPNTGLAGAVVSNYTGAPSQMFNNDLIAGRIDHEVAARDTVFGRFTLNSPFTVAPADAAFTGYNGLTKDWNVQLALGNTFIATPHIVNETTIGYVRFERSKGSQAANTQDYVQQLGIQGVTPPPYAWAAPSVALTGLSTVGYTAGQAVYAWQTTSMQYVDNLAIEKGRHTFNMGGSINTKTLRSNQYSTANGGYTFNGEFTATNPTTTVTSANAVADLLFGYPSAYSLNATPYMESFLYNFIGAYFQDDFKVSENLSINLGARWEYFGKPADRNNQIATFDLVAGKQVVAGTTSLPRSLVNPFYGDFSPRIGFGWRIPSTNTSLRGGFGIFYSPEVINSFRNLGFQNPFGVTYTLSVRPANPAAPQPAFTAQNPLAGATPTVNTATVVGINPNFREAYTSSWHLTLQQMLGKRSLLEIAYRGTSSQHLTSELNYNLTNPYPAQPPGFILNYPYPAFSTVNYFNSNGAGNYNALQVRFQQSVWHGLELQANYTWDKNMTNIDQSSVGSTASSGDDYAPQTLNLHQNYGWAAAGRPQEFVLSAIYAVPFMKHSTTAVGELVGGWSIGLDTTLAAGDRLTPSAYGTTYTGARANVTGDPNLPRGQRTIHRFYDTSKVTNPLPGQLGNAGKGSIFGSGTNLSNAVLIKNFALPREQDFEFRAEFFNVFNHTQFDDPNVYANTDPVAGTVTSANDYGYTPTERIIQLALRYKF